MKQIAKVLLVIMAVVLAVILFYLFLPKPQQKPEQVAIEYYRNLALKQSGPMIDVAKDSLLPRIKYKLLKKSVAGDTATVMYEIISPDISGEIEDLLKVLFSGKKEDDVKREMGQKLDQLLKPGKYKIRTSRLSFYLVRDGSGWKIENVKQIKSSPKNPK
jgi:hypothetical protein